MSWNATHAILLMFPNFNRKPRRWTNLDSLLRFDPLGLSPLVMPASVLVTLSPRRPGHTLFLSSPLPRARLSLAPSMRLHPHLMCFVGLRLNPGGLDGKLSGLLCSCLLVSEFPHLWRCYFALGFSLGGLYDVIAAQCPSLFVFGTLLMSLVL